MKPDPAAEDLKDWAETNNALPPDDDSDLLVPAFSPHRGRGVFDWWIDVASAPGKPLFMTFPFGIVKDFRSVFDMNDGVLRFGLLDKYVNGGNAASRAAAIADIERIRRHPNVGMALGQRIFVDWIDGWHQESRPIGVPLFESRREVKSTATDVTTMRLPGRFWSFLFFRCPNCRRGRLFNSWIRWIEMNDHCPCCGLGFYLESGYFVGSIYINYGATVAIVIVSLFFSHTIPERFQLVFFSCLAALTSLAFFRHSRSLWITIDYWINPWKPPQGAGSVCAVDRDPQED